MENFAAFTDKAVKQFRFNLATKTQTKTGTNVIDTLNTTVDNVTYKVELIA